MPRARRRTTIPKEEAAVRCRPRAPAPSSWRRRGPYGRRRRSPQPRLPFPHSGRQRPRWPRAPRSGSRDRPDPLSSLRARRRSRRAGLDPRRWRRRDRAGRRRRDPRRRRRDCDRTVPPRDLPGCRPRETSSGPCGRARCSGRGDRGRRPRCSGTRRKTRRRGGWGRRSPPRTGRGARRR